MKERPVACTVLLSYGTGHRLMAYTRKFPTKLSTKGDEDSVYCWSNCFAVAMALDHSSLAMTLNRTSRLSKRYLLKCYNKNALNEECSRIPV